MSARFVKLTGADGEPRWVRAEAIVDMRQYQQDDPLTCIDCLGGYSPSVRETPEQILALLAAPAPAPSVEVTDEAVEAALDAEHAEAVAKGYRRSWRESCFPEEERRAMRAAIEAADRARGLRP